MFSKVVVGTKQTLSTHLNDICTWFWWSYNFHPVPLCWTFQLKDWYKNDSLSRFWAPWWSSFSWTSLFRNNSATCSFICLWVIRQASAFDSEQSAISRNITRIAFISVTSFQEVLILNWWIRQTWSMDIGNYCLNAYWQRTLLFYWFRDFIVVVDLPLKLEVSLDSCQK